MSGTLPHRFVLGYQHSRRPKAAVFREVARALRAGQGNCLPVQQRAGPSLLALAHDLHEAAQHARFLSADEGDICCCSVTRIPAGGQEAKGGSDEQPAKLAQPQSLHFVLPLTASLINFQAKYSLT